ncbi:hypothetical protein [Rhodoferax sp.]|uniref:hypothetical protein n=1 Tax=Rhodoferax sp. TaxID=50421 RepID=UPI0026075F53|nr:hypothetical protein [Rhodoferax sp.]
MQAKQLANRTAYLKIRADQVDAAALGFGSLQAKLASIEGQVAAVDVDMANTQVAALKYALTQAALANDSIKALRQHVQQEGEVTITNRGLVSGAGVAPFGASRLLSIAAGVCFIGGRKYAVEAQNSLSVPLGGAASAVCYGYLFLDASKFIRFYVSELGAAVPANGIKVCTLTVPAGNSDAALAGVTITQDARREPNYPISLGSPVQVGNSINALDNNEYRLDFDVVAAAGAPCPRESVSVVSRAANGFTVQLASAADDVVVRWRASALRLPAEQPLSSGWTDRLHAASPTTY